MRDIFYRHPLPNVDEAGGGSIINVASVHGLLSGRASAPPDAAKAATINLTR